MRKEIQNDLNLLMLNVKKNHKLESIINAGSNCDLNVL